MGQFRITYDGPALQARGIDVRELAPALLAAGDLLHILAKCKGAQLLTGLVL